MARVEHQDTENVMEQDSRPRPAWAQETLGRPQDTGVCHAAHGG